MSVVGRIAWLRRRLAVMSAPEIAFRLSTALRERLAVAGGWLRPPAGRALPEALLRATFLTAREPRLFAPPVARDAGHEEHLLAGEVPVFGSWVPVRPEREFWHRDPASGAAWAQVPYRQIDYRPGNATGDVRRVWELNRLQHLFGLAVIAQKDPARRAAAVGLLERDLQAWHRANPPGIGVNYLSAMEEALRLISLFHAYDLVRTWVSPATGVLLATVADQHARHLRRRLSLYSSAGNHTIAEATGLLYAGILLPEHPAAADWRATGRRLLRTEAARQVDADGGGLEQATWYLLFITDLLGLAQALLAHAGEPAEAAVDDALVRSRGFLNALAAGPGDLPRIGDADDGYALSAGLRLSWRERGPQPQPGPAPGLRSWRIAGLSQVRFGAGDQLLFLHNPLGMAPGFGHGHADCLAVLFRLEGTDLFIDPGTYLYGGPDGHRRYFRSARGHNTATVDGADPAEQAGPFLWARPYTASLVLSRLDADCACLLARHDGYARQGVTHWRGVVYRRDRYLAVWDCFTGAARHDTGAASHDTGAASHEVTVRWHLGCPVLGGDVARDERPPETGRERLALLAPDGRRLPLEVSGGALTVASGVTTPGLLGWRSTRYGEVEPCTVLEIRANSWPVRNVVTLLGLGTPDAGDRPGLDAVLAEFERLAVPSASGTPGPTARDDRRGDSMQSNAADSLFQATGA